MNDAPAKMQLPCGRGLVSMVWEPSTVKIALENPGMQKRCFLERGGSSNRNGADVSGRGAWILSLQFHSEKSHNPSAMTTTPHAVPLESRKVASIRFILSSGTKAYT